MKVLNLDPLRNNGWTFIPSRGVSSGRWIHDRYTGTHDTDRALELQAEFDSHIQPEATHVAEVEFNP